MERDPEKMLELILGVTNVRILGVEATSASVRIELESIDDVAVCPRCGAQAELLSTKSEEKVDLPVMGRPTRLVVKRRRWHCLTAQCPVTKWLEPDPTDEFPASSR
jgi:transposase